MHPYSQPKQIEQESRHSLPQYFLKTHRFPGEIKIFIQSTHLRHCSQKPDKNKELPYLKCPSIAHNAHVYKFFLYFTHFIITGSLHPHSFLFMLVIDMRTFVILSMLTFLSLMASLSIIFTWPDNSSPVKPKSTISDAAWQTYFEAKGKADNRRLSDFAALLNSPWVLGAKNEIIPQDTQKESYKIAVLGDSMIDIMGDFPYLKEELKKYFPKTEFEIYNYGTGAATIEVGLSHLLADYVYADQQKTALLNLNPDIVVVESFAYNHWGNTQGDLDRQWLAMADIAGTIKRHSKDIKIIFATTIAPYCPTFADGSANLPPERKLIECETVKSYLKNTINFATSQNYPLADAYSKSLVNDEGLPNYINQKDHLHPSKLGQQLFSSVLANAVAQVIE